MSVFDFKQIGAAEFLQSIRQGAKGREQWNRRLAVGINPWFGLLPAFVGAGLVYAGITDRCGMAMLLAKLPYNRRGAGSGSSVADLGSATCAAPVAEGGGTCAAPVYRPGSGAGSGPNR